MTLPSSSLLRDEATSNASLLAQQWVVWLNTIKNVSKHTLTAYCYDVSQFIEFLSNHYGKDLNAQDLQDIALQDFRSWLVTRSSSAYNPRSTRRAISGLKNFFQYLANHHNIDNKAHMLISMPKVKKLLPKNLTVQQSQGLLNTIHELASEPWVGNRNQALFMLLYGAGLRLGEALQLTYGDIIHAESGLKVLGKGKKQRLVPLLPPVMEAINHYIRLCPFSFEDKTPLFLGTRGKCLNPGIAQKEMRQYRSLYGLGERATPHSLRHSFATDLLSASGDLRAVQDLLGHASLSSTQIYTQLDQKDLLNIYRDTHPRAMARKTLKDNVEE